MKGAKNFPGGRGVCLDLTDIFLGGTFEVILGAITLCGKCLGGGLLKLDVTDVNLDVSKNSVFFPQIIHLFIGLEPLFSPSILGVLPLFLETPNWLMEIHPC